MELRPTALVTGAAVRIGRGIALRLAAEGFSVAIHYHRSRLEAEALAEEIEATGGRARLLECDLRDVGAASALVSEASGALGPVGLLVNNASVFHDDTAIEPDWDLWDAHFDLHLKAPVALAGALARSLPDGRQHDRPARAQADAAVLLLHAVEVGALDGHRDARAGARATHPRQRHRAGTDTGEPAPETR
jgi:NAD(P)-dependent dehydrogenase (short-subunit alcohol dehydrogenase family)